MAYLPTIEIDGMADPVVQIVREPGGEILYTLRIKGNTFRPKVFTLGTYSIHVGEPDTKRRKTITGVPSLPPTAARTLRVDL